MKRNTRQNPSSSNPQKRKSISFRSSSPNNNAIADQLQALNDRFDRIESSLIAFKDEITANLTSKEITINQLLETQSRLEKRIADLETSRNDLNKLQVKFSRMEQNSVASNLMIRGIPMDENISLPDTFTALCNTIVCQEVTPLSIYRLKNSIRNNTSTDAGVVVKLRSPSDKSAVLKAAAIFRKNNNTNLQLNHAGIESAAPIFLNECLTKHKKHLLNAAVQHKRKGKLHAVFTLRGNVFVKICSDGAPIEVSSMSTLKEITHSAAPPLNGVPPAEDTNIVQASASLVPSAPLQFFRDGLGEGNPTGGDS